MTGTKQNLTWTEAFSLLILLGAVFFLYALAFVGPIDHAARTSLAALPSETSAKGRTASILDYDIGDIRSGRADVPRLFLVTMPANYFEIETIPERKQEFLRILLPLVLLVNEEIRVERQHLLEMLALRESGSEIPGSAESWLAALTAKYKVGPTDFDLLLQRVDVVSPAVTVSQAVEETGWGRSRFVKQGNAIFGERTWTKGRGIVPIRRPEDGRYEVRRFGSLLESVRAYAWNLNTHEAYSSYRTTRADLRRLGRHNPAELAATLLAYSERGGAYIKAIRRIIRDNQLQHFETAKLTGVAPANTVEPTQGL